MGDHERLYVSQELVPVYAENIASIASIITPNQFEAEKLLGRKIETEQDALAACQELHNRGPHTVVSDFNKPDMCISQDQRGRSTVAWVIRVHHQSASPCCNRPCEPTQTVVSRHSSMRTWLLWCLTRPSACAM